MFTQIDAQAPVVVRHELRIEAPRERLWQLLVDVPSWPRWQPDITAAEADLPLRTGGTFGWSTAGLDIESTVYELAAPRRLLWGGTSQGIQGIHLWTLTTSGSTVRVHTEESWDGAPVLADVAGMRAVLDESLAAWLGHLKRAAERSAP